MSEIPKPTSISFSDLMYSGLLTDLLEVSEGSNKIPLMASVVSRKTTAFTRSGLAYQGEAFASHCSHFEFPNDRLSH